MLCFFFWQHVYYVKYETTFPSTSPEGTGHFVGFSEHVGHALCYKILTDDTQQILHRASVRPYDPSDPNLRATLFGGEDDSPIVDPVIKSHSDTHTDNISNQNDSDDSDHTTSGPAMFDPEALIGRTFLMDPLDDGQQHRARIVKMLEDHESDVESNPTRLKFVCSVNNDNYEEVITYNQMLEYITRDEGRSDKAWEFQCITAHQGPLKPDHPDYKGSSYNVMIEWENGETTSEPLSIIAANDPVTCAIYARDHNLLELPGWKRFKPIAK